MQVSRQSRTIQDKVVVAAVIFKVFFFSTGKKKKKSLIFKNYQTEKSSLEMLRIIFLCGKITDTLKNIFNKT